MRILVVDDSQEWCHLYLESFKEAGFDVEVFSSLSEAKEAKGPFDVYVVDSYIDVPAGKPISEGPPPDGVIWARELAGSGRKVVLCSWEVFQINGIRYVPKDEHTHQELVSLLERI